MKNSIIEIEVNGPKNNSLFFGPLARRLRGRYILARATETDGDATKLSARIKSEIPGQRIGLDFESGEGYVIEPLQGDAHRVMRERILKEFRLDPERESVGKVDVPTWLHFIKRAVEAGYAVVAEGAIPDEIKGNPKLSFFSTQHAPIERQLSDAMQAQTEAINRQTDMLARVLAELTKAVKK